MSEQIIQRVISSVNDKRLVLFNSQVARQLSIGSSWNYLRIGIRFGVQGTATFGPFRLFVGVTSGVDHVYYSDYCQHALVCVLGLSVTNATYSATAGGTYSLGSGPVVYSKISQTETSQQASYVGGTATYVAADAPNRNCFQTYDFVKLGGGLFTCVMNGAQSSSGTPVGNVSYDVIRAAMLSTSYIDSAAIAGLNQGTPRNTTVALNEGTNGAFDSVYVYWRHPTVGLEISDIIVSRLS